MKSVFTENQLVIANSSISDQNCTTRRVVYVKRGSTWSGHVYECYGLHVMLFAGTIGLCVMFVN